MLLCVIFLFYYHFFYFSNYTSNWIIIIVLDTLIVLIKLPFCYFFVSCTASLLGFDHNIPSFATARESEIVQGVNYASGSAGILDQSGNNLV